MTATVIFDLDGTLVNTEALYLKSNVKAAAVLGLHRTEADFQPRMFWTRFAAVPILSYPELTKRCRRLIGWVID